MSLIHDRGSVEAILISVGKLYMYIVRVFFLLIRIIQYNPANNPFSPGGQMFEA